MIPQMKGKMVETIPKSRLKDGIYLVQTKFDGNYIQIHKYEDVVTFYTSGGKRFYLKDVADALKTISENFVIEGEFIADTDGRLGSRPKAAKLTTYRTNYGKGIESNLSSDKIILFDLIIPGTAKARYDKLVSMLSDILPGLKVVDTEYFTLDEAKEYTKGLVNIGYEGVMCKHEDNIYDPGKRVNDIIKIKYRMTADLKCIDVTEGEGKYQGMIGALVLEDKEGRIVSVGSGLDDAHRAVSPETYIGKIIEIEYEQILDTYIQPIFVCVRTDK